MPRSRVANRVAAIESSSRSPEISQSTDGSCHLSIEIPYNFACRVVESSIGSPQSRRRVVLQKFLSRLMSPDSIEVRIRDNSNNPHAAGSAGSEGGDDEAARAGAFWRPQDPELSRPRPARPRSDPPTSLTAPNSIFLEPLVGRSPVVPPQWCLKWWRLATLLQTLCFPPPPASPSFSRLPPLRRPTAAKSRLSVRVRRTCGPVWAV